MLRWPLIFERAHTLFMQCYLMAYMSPLAANAHSPALGHASPHFYAIYASFVGTPFPFTSARPRQCRQNYAPTANTARRFINTFFHYRMIQ